MKLWLAMAALVLLVQTGCGVGGEGTGAITGTTAASGPIEGFGSVIVAGQRFDDSKLRASREIQPGQPQAMLLSALRPGMQVELLATGTEASTLSVRPQVVGTVTEINASGRRLVVAGQTVIVQAVAAEPTLLDGVSELSDLEVGDRVEVHGFHDASGALRASYLARSSTLTGDRVAGLAQDVDPAAERLRIGGLWVDTRIAQRLPAGATPAQGDNVVAWGTLGSDGVLRALLLQRLGPASQPDLDSLRISGRVGGFRSATDFQIEGQRVDASQAQLDGDTAEGLISGRLVTAEGPRRAGVLQARRIALRADSSAPTVEIAAIVADYAGAQGFRLRGVAVDVSNATFSALLPANVGNGVALVVRGRVEGARLRVMRVETALFGNDVLISLGETSEIRATSRRFKIIGLEPQFRLADNVRFVGGDLAGWTEGVHVELRSRLVGNEQVVEQLRYLEAAPARQLAGVAGNVEVAPSGLEGAFDIGPTDLFWDNATAFIGLSNSAADLRNGILIRVSARLEGSRLVANRVDTRPTQPGQVLLRGTVSDFQSLASFRIDGQRIDGSAALFAPVSLASDLVGAYVDVEGSLIDGVVRATRVSDP